MCKRIRKEAKKEKKTKTTKFTAVKSQHYGISTSPKWQK